MTGNLEQAAIAPHSVWRVSILGEPGVILRLGVSCALELEQLCQWPLACGPFSRAKWSIHGGRYE